MENENLQQGRITVTNPIDDTHKTFKHLKKAGITEAQAEVFTETFKGLADQTIQVNGNLLLVRDELRGEFRKEFTAVRKDITGIHLKLKDIDHKIDSNYHKLDAKIDFSQTTLLGYMEKSNAQAETRHAHALVNNMRWNIGMFIGTVTMFICLAGLMIALV